MSQPQSEQKLRRRVLWLPLRCVAREAPAGAKDWGAVPRVFKARDRRDE